MTYFKSFPKQKKRLYFNEKLQFVSRDYYTVKYMYNKRQKFVERTVRLMKSRPHLYRTHLLALSTVGQPPKSEPTAWWRQKTWSWFEYKGRICIQLECWESQLNAYRYVFHSTTVSDFTVGYKSIVVFKIIIRT